MKKIAITLTAASIAALVGGCQTTSAQPSADRDFPIGHWGGKNRFRPRIETRIEDVAEDRIVRGTTCWRETSGVISGQRLEEIVRVSETGLSLRFDIGKGQFHVQRSDGRKAIMWETRTRADGTLTRPLRTRMTARGKRATRRASRPKQGRRQRWAQIANGRTSDTRPHDERTDRSPR